MNFTLVSTVFNEAGRLSQTIQDLKAQIVQPSEIIITDAGSTDDTYKILLAWKEESKLPITILLKKGCNVAEGRNLAIRGARYDLIVSTDFGCRFHKEWLASITAPFKDPSIDVVGGGFTVNENDQESLAAKAAYILFNGYQVNVNDPSFIPSSRSIAYRKKVFDTIGGYCEWLTLAADDLVFGKEIKSKGFNILVIDKPYVYWGRHKKAKGYVKEANRYGLGDGEARVNHRNFLSNGISLLFRFSFCVLFVVFMVFPSHFNLLILIPCLLILAAGFRNYMGYVKSWIKFKSAKYNLKVFLYGIYLMEATRLSYIKGYVRGLTHASDYQKEQAKLLKERFAKKLHYISTVTV